MSKVPNTPADFLKQCDDAQAADPALLTWRHPRFAEFVDRLFNAYRYPVDWPPVCHPDLPLSRDVLTAMGGFDLDHSVAWLKCRGGLYCDCAVLWSCIAYKDFTPEEMLEAEDNVRRYSLGRKDLTL